MATVHRTGELRKRVRFEIPKRTADAGGGASITWTPALTTWGAFVLASGQEKVAAGRLQASATGTLTVRSCLAARQVDESYRVLIDEVPFQIRGAGNPDQRNRFIEFAVEVGVAV